MEYFIMCQDHRIANYAEPIGILKQIEKPLPKRQNEQALNKEPIQFYVKTKKDMEYIHFIERPVHLISDDLKQLFEQYQQDVFYKPVMLANIGKMSQELYWHLRPQAIECLSPKTEFNKKGTLKKIILDEDKIEKNKVFKIKGILEDFLLVSMDVAEDILKREYLGVTFKRIEK